MNLKIYFIDAFKILKVNNGINLYSLKVFIFREASKEIGRFDPNFNIINFKAHSKFFVKKKKLVYKKSAMSIDTNVLRICLALAKAEKFLTIILNSINCYRMIKI